jgi:hypothetical protein
MDVLLASLFVKSLASGSPDPSILSLVFLGYECVVECLLVSLYSAIVCLLWVFVWILDACFFVCKWKVTHLRIFCIIKMQYFDWPQLRDWFPNTYRKRRRKLHQTESDIEKKPIPSSEWRFDTLIEALWSRFSDWQHMGIKVVIPVYRLYRFRLELLLCRRKRSYSRDNRV